MKRFDSVLLFVPFSFYICLRVIVTEWKFTPAQECQEDEKINATCFANDTKYFYVENAFVVIRKLNSQGNFFIRFHFFTFCIIMLSHSHEIPSFCWQCWKRTEKIFFFCRVNLISAEASFTLTVLFVSGGKEQNELMEREKSSNKNTKKDLFAWKKRENFRCSFISFVRSNECEE